MTSQFWVKQKGYPWWPARASSEGDAPEDVLRKRPKSCVLVQYYQSDDYLWCNPEGKEVVEYGQGKAHDTHAEAAQKGQNQKLKRAVFLAEQAREQQHRGSSSRKHRSGQADTSSAKRKRPAEPAEQPAQSSSSGFSEADWTVGVKVKASFKVPKQRAKWFTGSITDAASSENGWCISVHFGKDGSDEDYVLPRDIDDIKPLVSTASGGIYVNLQQSGSLPTSELLKVCTRVCVHATAHMCVCCVDVRSCADHHTAAKPHRLPADSADRCRMVTTHHR